MPGKTHRIGPSLIDTAKAFASEESCHEYLEASRWPNGVRCLKCDHDKVSKFTVPGKTYFSKPKNAMTHGPDRFMYQCLKCDYQFQTTTGTLFSDTHLPLSKWMMAVALMCNAKKGLSAKQLERDLGVSYKTAWYLNHRIRKAMDEGEIGEALTGVVEADETYIGGKYDKRRGRAKYDKEPVFGMVERKGKVRTWHMKNITRWTVMDKLKGNISIEASAIYTDESKIYKRMPPNTPKHEIVNHSVKEYARGEVHTGTIDGYWSLLKRGIIGSFHRVSVKHLHRYLSEFQFRWNSREDQEIFATIIIGLVIKNALRYKTLTGPEVPPFSGPAVEGPEYLDDEPF